MLDGNLICGGIGEDVFMADIVQAWHREGKETVKLTQEKRGTRLRRNTMLALSPSGTRLAPLLSASIIPPSRLKDIRKASESSH